MPKDTKGFIYILTNPSFPAYVKIGYADNVEERLAKLNTTECTPFAFRLYATYEVETRLSDTRVHNIIDKLNPDLRAYDEINGRPRKREFFAMTAQDAFSILEAIAEINGRDGYLHLCEMSEEEREDEREAKEAEERRRERLSPFSFDKCNIEVGEEIVFTCSGNEFDGTPCRVVSNKKVEYDGEEWYLSALACALTNRTTLRGPSYFKYKGRWLNDIRAELEGWAQNTSSPRVADSWIIPCNPSYYDVESAFEELDAIEWRQTTYIQTGDTVYIYVASPAQALMFKCLAEETEMYGPAEIDDLRFYHGEPHKENERHMRLRLVESYDADKYPLSKLKKYGLTNVQGPCRIPVDLEEILSGE